MNPLRNTIIIVTMFAAIAMITHNAAAGELTIRAHSIDCGGGYSTGTTLTLRGVIGQPDAATLAADSLTVRGGFLPALTGGTACLADLDGNAQVDVADLIALLGAWGTDDHAADLDDNGLVDVGDLIQLLGAWGACP